MPVSAICTAPPMRPVALAESASTQITHLGSTRETMLSSISAVSIPVTPNTPGATAHTLRMRSSA